MWITDPTGGTYYDGREEFQRMLEHDEQRLARRGSGFSWFVMFLLGFMFRRRR